MHDHPYTPQAMDHPYRAVGMGKNPVRPIDGGVARIVRPGWVREGVTPPAPARGYGGAL